jgi:predicted nucleic acid-binding protein
VKFLDTNVILRYLVRDDEGKAEAARTLFQRVDRGEEELTTSETVWAEAVYVLSSRALYGLPREDIRDRLQPLVAWRGLRLSNRKLVQRALELYADNAFLDFEDALSVAHMEEQGIAEIVSYDADFDSISGITRAEP